MFKRVMVAVIGIPFLLVVFLWTPDWVTMLLIAAMCAIGAHELVHAVAGAQARHLAPLTVLMAALVPLTVYACDLGAAPIENSILSLYNAMQGRSVAPALSLPLLALVFVFLLFVYAILHYGKETAVPFAHLTGAIFAGLVFPLMLSCLLRLRLLPDGRALIFVPLCISFGSDTFALFAGMLCGRHKLAPRVSPKKTVEGAVGGLLGGVIGMALFKLALHLLSAGMGFGGMDVVLGLLGSVVSQIGDLSFSVVKREFGVKDYGKLLPGHGGILDRFDSVTFVAPFVWMIFTILE